MILVATYLDRATAQPFAYATQVFEAWCFYLIIDPVLTMLVLKMIWAYSFDNDCAMFLLLSPLQGFVFFSLCHRALPYVDAIAPLGHLAINDGII
jgi:hypothetical protein